MFFIQSNSPMDVFSILPPSDISGRTSYPMSSIVEYRTAQAIRFTVQTFPTGSDPLLYLDSQSGAIFAAGVVMTSPSTRYTTYGVFTGGALKCASLDSSMSPIWNQSSCTITASVRVATGSSTVPTLWAFTFIPL